MTCPNCERISLCGCSNCKRRNGKMPLYRTEINAMSGDGIKCPYCRKSFTFDEAFEYSLERYDRIEEQNEILSK